MVLSVSVACQVVTKAGASPTSLTWMILQLLPSSNTASPDAVTLTVQVVQAGLGVVMSRTLPSMILKWAES